jgi:hypothetical protein
MGFLDKMKDAANQATKATGMGTGMGIGDQAAYRNQAIRLNQAGVNHPATVKTMAETGNSDAGSKEVQFEVEVRPADAGPYAASFRQFMVEGSLTGVAEGSEITVRVDPDDPSSMLFWGAGAP